MKGTFKGSIGFDPDAHLPGFARTGSFAGQIETVPRWHCPAFLKPPTFDPGAGGINVNATNCDDGRNFGASVEVDPATPPPPPGDGEATPAAFSASWTKSIGIARVSYSISVEGGAGTAVFSGDLSEGTIKPPSPFHGQATIRRQGEGWEWSGSLSARFPGRTVRLTGRALSPSCRPSSRVLTRPSPFSTRCAAERPPRSRREVLGLNYPVLALDSSSREGFPVAE